MKYKDLENEWSRKWFQFIKDNPDKEWDWRVICWNENLTWEIIRDNPDKNWNWFRLAILPIITMDIIKNNPDKPWTWESITYNPNITMDIIKDNPDKPWDWQDISANEFAKQKTDFIVKEYHKHIMAFRIQNRWKNALVNPNCRLGIRKIERDMIYAGL